MGDVVYYVSYKEEAGIAEVHEHTVNPTDFYYDVIDTFAVSPEQALREYLEDIRGSIVYAHKEEKVVETALAEILSRKNVGSDEISEAHKELQAEMFER